MCVQHAQSSNVSTVYERQGCSDVVADVWLTGDNQQRGKQRIGVRVTDFKQFLTINGMRAKSVFTRRALHIKACRGLYPQGVVVEKRQKRDWRIEGNGCLVDEAVKAWLGKIVQGTSSLYGS